MNQTQLQGNWKQLQGKFHEFWGELTDDDLKESQGKSEVLIGKIAERYGIAKEEAAKKFNHYVEKLEDTPNPIAAVGTDIANKTREMADKASHVAKDYWQYAKDRPLATLSIAAAAGVILGLLFKRSSH